MQLFMKQAQICAEGCEGGLLMHALALDYIGFSRLACASLDFSCPERAFPGLFGRVWACLGLFGLFMASLVLAWLDWDCMFLVFHCLGMSGHVWICLSFSVSLYGLFWAYFGLS